MTVVKAADTNDNTIQLYESVREGPWGEPLEEFHDSLSKGTI